jgi:aerobic-type carbon monoxide dehydrogenase small subunit (CoxS/CutS family)
MTQTTLKLNGSLHQVESAPETPLLYVLRDELGLHSAKFGCGLGQCGACTVMIDREASFSCLVPLAALMEREVHTVEGLGSASQPGPIQRAFIELQAAQCGYCIAGMMMRASALLSFNHDPSEAQIRRFMSPNLCRCGTHMRIVAAVRRAAELLKNS